MNRPSDFLATTFILLIEKLLEESNNILSILEKDQLLLNTDALESALKILSINQLIICEYYITFMTAAIE